MLTQTKNSSPSDCPAAGILGPDLVWPSLFSLISVKILYLYLRARRGASCRPSRYRPCPSPATALLPWLGLARIGFLLPLPPSPLLSWARILGGVEAAGLVVAMCASGILIINYTNSEWKRRGLPSRKRARFYSVTQQVIG